MKLSIVMMIKNEEKHLEKTLSSFEGIRNEIETELIILDTGSTDKSVDIAKKYTDKVFFKQWNDDFSDMRNTSISYAKGEWLLILDADEPITNYSNLIDFFKTSKHTKYNSGTVEIINIMSENPIRRATCQIPRFFRNSKKFCYKGIIHEQPQFKYPLYNNIITCDHYGYLYDDNKLKKKKSERNLELLKKQLKENPDSPYINFHISSTYKQLNLIKESLEYAKKSYFYMKKKKEMHNYVYSNYINILLVHKEWKKAYEICKEYLKIDDKNIDILYQAGYIAATLQDVEESLKYYWEYLYLVENYHESSNAKDITLKCECLDMKDKAYSTIISLYYKLKRYEDIIEVFEKYEFNKTSSYGEFILALYEVDRFNEILKYYNQIEEIIQKKRFKKSLEDVMKVYFEKDDLQRVYQILSKFEGDYGIFNSYRIDNVYSKQIEEILLNSDEIYYSNIINIYIKKENTIPECLKNIYEEKLLQMLNYCIDIEWDFKFYLENYIKQAPNSIDIKTIKLYKLITKLLLFKGGFVEESYNLIFDLYKMYNKYYIDFIYPEFVKSDIKSYLRTSEELFIYELFDLDKTKEIEYIRGLKNIVSRYTQYEPAINYLKQEFEKEINLSSELKKLQKDFINSILNSLSPDNIKSINDLINQYKEIFGEDCSILNIIGMVCIYENELDNAEYYFKRALSFDIYNVDILYNIAYVKELKGCIKESREFYTLCKKNTKNEEIINLCDVRLSSDIQ